MTPLYIGQALTSTQTYSPLYVQPYPGRAGADTHAPGQHPPFTSAVQKRVLAWRRFEIAVIAVIVVTVALLRRYPWHKKASRNIGGFIEPFAFGSGTAPDEVLGANDTSALLEIAPPYVPFGLSNATCASSFAPGMTYSVTPLVNSYLQLANPYACGLSRADMHTVSALPSRWPWANLASTRHRHVTVTVGGSRHPRAGVHTVSTLPHVCRADAVLTGHHHAIRYWSPATPPKGSGPNPVEPFLLADGKFTKRHQGVE